MKDFFPVSKTIDMIKLKDFEESNKLPSDNYKELLRILQQTKEHLQIGVKVPPMYRKKGLMKFVAKIVAKIYLRIAKITTRDQIIVNNNFFDVINNLISEVGRLENLFNEDKKIRAKNEYQFMIDAINGLQSKISNLENELTSLKKVIDNIELKNFEEISLLSKEVNHFKDHIMENDIKVDQISSSFSANYEKEVKEIAEKINIWTSKINEISYAVYKNQVNIRHQERRLNVTLDELKRKNVETNKLVAIQNSLDREFLDTMYVHFEDAFRGSRAEIKDRLKYYLPSINCMEKNSLILDIGCGRGEWLELLTENGFDPTGIDLNSAMIEICKENHLNSLQVDAFSYLSSLPDNYLDMITAFHVIEHIPFPQQITFLNEIYRVLKPNGFIILETPNPKNVLVGSGNFYCDPTHNNPVFPETLHFLLEYLGYSELMIHYLNDMDIIKIPALDSDVVSNRINSLFYGAQDYSITGCKK